MKSFEKNIADICDIELSALALGGKYSVYANHTAVIEGHGGLLVYDGCKMSFKMQKGVLSVEGSGLTICRLGKNFAVVRGDIVSVSVKNV